MLCLRNGSNGSYALVAAIAAMLGAVATWGSPKFVESSKAQPVAAPGQLLTQKLGNIPGREVRISLLDRDPGSSSARHRHPGHHTFGYVLEGSYEFATNGEPPRILHTGEVFYEPPTAVHSTSWNPSAEKRTKILIFMVADQNNPSTVPE